MSNTLSIDNMDIKRFTRCGNENYWTEVTINEKQYILEFNLPTDEMSAIDTLFITIWATPTGEYHPPPNDPLDLGTTLASKSTPHEKIYHQKVKYGKLDIKYDSFSSFVSESLNEAICIIENKAEETQKMKDQVRAALEANKEVHGDIEDQLELDS